MAFQDHFSSRASAYARARPTYPAGLFAELARLAQGHDLAWDCGTGNGQAALGLAEYFGSVVGTDPSEAQLAEAVPHPRVTYRQLPESSSGLDPCSVDLVTAAQAAHWFDLGLFYLEVARVLRPGGLLAMWCYGLCRIAPDIDDILGEFYHRTVGPCWPPERRHVDAAYRSLRFPWPDLPFPRFEIERVWTLPELLAYVETWSAVTRYRDTRGEDPLSGLGDALERPWGPPDSARHVTWPVSMRAGRAP
jgi:SAM-dependent methyltransferase